MRYNSSNNLNKKFHHKLSDEQIMKIQNQVKLIVIYFMMFSYYFYVYIMDYCNQ